eukprot:gene3106-5276_t
MDSPKLNGNGLNHSKTLEPNNLNIYNVEDFLETNQTFQKEFLIFINEYQQEDFIRSCLKLFAQKNGQKSQDEHENQVHDLYEQIKELKIKKQKEFLRMKNIQEQNDYLNEKVQILQILANEKQKECIQQQTKLSENTIEIEKLQDTVNKLQNNYLAKENSELRELVESLQNKQTERDVQLNHKEEEIKKYISNIQETLSNREKIIMNHREEIIKERQKLVEHFEFRELVYQQKIKEIEFEKMEILKKEKEFELEKEKYYKEKMELESKFTKKVVSSPSKHQTSKSFVQPPYKPNQSQNSKIYDSKENSTKNSPILNSNTNSTLTLSPPKPNSNLDESFGTTIISPKSTEVSSNGSNSPTIKVSTKVHVSTLRDLYENKATPRVSSSTEGSSTPPRKGSHSHFIGPTMNIESFNSFKELEKKLERKKSEPDQLKSLSSTNESFKNSLKSPRVTNQSTLLTQFYKGIKEENLDLSNKKLSSIEIFQLCVSLKDNKFVKNLNLESTGISDKQMSYLCSLIENNKSIEHLNLAGNNDITNWNPISNALLNNNTICNIEFGNTNDFDKFEEIQEKLKKNQLVKI